MICRNEKDAIAASTRIKEKSGNHEVLYNLCDVANFSHVRELSKSLQVSCPRLDALVLNAGCMPVARQQTSKGHEVIMATALGGVLLADLLIPIMEMSTEPRIVMVSSGGG